MANSADNRRKAMESWWVYTLGEVPHRCTQSANLQLESCDNEETLENTERIPAPKNYNSSMEYIPFETNRSTKAHYELRPEKV